MFYKHFSSIRKVQALKVFCFLLIVVVVDQVAGQILHKLYFKQKTGQNANLNYTLQECNANILIFGNSRAQHHYDSRIIADSFKMSCYNAGLDGGHSILMQYAQIKAITNRYIPKIIILEFHPNSIVRYTGDYDKLSILLPYYNDYPEFKPFILLRSPYEKIKLLSAIYPFNSNIVNIIRYNTNTHAARKKDFDGFVPIYDKVMKLGILDNVPEIVKESVADTNMINALKNLIFLCIEKNISLFIISSPIFHTANTKQDITTFAAKISLDIIQQNNVNYIDLSYDSTFTKRLEYFADNLHLNDKGAEVFTTMVVEKIRNTHKKY